MLGQYNYYIDVYDEAGDLLDQLQGCSGVGQEPLARVLLQEWIVGRIMQVRTRISSANDYFKACECEADEPAYDLLEDAFAEVDMLKSLQQQLSDAE